MRRSKSFCLPILVLTFLVPHQLLAAPIRSRVIAQTPAQTPAQTAAQEERTERERKKNADRAAKRAAEQTKEYQETMKEVAGDLEEIGAQLLQTEYSDPFLQDYVNELGQNLIPKETPEGTLFSFRVLDDAEPNAFALPDGRIYVNTGLLLFVENEAQLAMVLGHEIGHVLERHYVESVRAQKREALIGSVIGIAGAALGGLLGGKKGAAVGAVSGVIVAKVRMNNYSKKQEDEADALGATLALDRRYDPREAVSFFKKLTNTYGDQGRFANALYGKHSRNKDRQAYIEQLVSGNLSAQYNEQRTAGTLTSGSGQMQMYASRMVRDVAITLMDDYDQYAVAKEHLERIADYRASDPRTLWALGRVFKRVGRTEQDRAKALDFFQRAVRLDERNLYPYIHFDLGLMQARLGSTAAAVESLKKYVVNYVSRYHEHPGNLESTYDYLLTFGDRNWTAPAVDSNLVRAVNTTPTRPAAPAVTVPEASQPIAATKPPAKGDPKKAEPPKPVVKKTGRGGGGGN